MIPAWIIAVPFAVFSLIAIALWYIRKPKKDPIMATIQDLRNALEAQAATNVSLTAAVARAVPILQSADPVALDGILASINSNTVGTATETANLNAAMPPQ